jgi:hypothetical protein
VVLSSDVIERIEDILNTIPQTYWRNYSIDSENPTGSKAKVYKSLSLKSIFDQNELMVCVTPALLLPGVAEEGRRSPIARKEVILYITIAKKFEEIDTEGNSVTTWNEEKALSDFREQLDLYFYEMLDRSDLQVEDPESGDVVQVKLLEIEPTEPPELELDERHYLTITSFTFEMGQCKALIKK